MQSKLIVKEAKDDKSKQEKKRESSIDAIIVKDS